MIESYGGRAAAAAWGEGMTRHTTLMDVEGQYLTSPLLSPYIEQCPLTVSIPSPPLPSLSFPRRHATPGVVSLDRSKREDFAF
ncbi:hypothetical protein GW17_00013822 [Ensete ventricosum]|nr:hypothetical protein GW17_00013822 [Ensete ventricosum]